MSTTQGVIRLLMAAALAGLIGLDRELRHKDAGLRTHILVGVGAALVMMVSQYGFANVLLQEAVVLDPSRVAAQVVSGIGFLGAGLIFVRRGGVQGLTTAAGVWLAAGIGLAVGSGLLLLGAAATAIGLGADLTFRLLEIQLRRSRDGRRPVEILVRCRDERGVLAGVTATLAAAGWNIHSISFDRDETAPGIVENRIQMVGGQERSLPGALAGVDGVVSVERL
jgi:putative Mg2+ transporter-C (MgtC) family protein